MNKKLLFPPKLKIGVEIRVISPARSLGIIAEDQHQLATQRWQNLGFTLSFGQYVHEMDQFYSSRIEHRLHDLHEAFCDPQVKGILTVIGGYNVNQLMDGIDYDLIAANPKPDLAGAILLIEDDSESHAATFDRDLQSLIHQPGFEKVKGLIIGRFQKESKIDNSTLTEIIRTKAALQHLPIIANASFGHTTPQFTFPIGGQGSLVVTEDKATFTITEH